MASEMASVLRRLKLDHLIDKFISEKITPDLVGKLSLNDFRELGVLVDESDRQSWSLQDELIPDRMRPGCSAAPLHSKTVKKRSHL